MKHNNTIIKGSLILTSAGIISRILGFFYRIFLSNTIGSEGLGLYQIVFPVAGVCLSLCSMGISTSVSRYTATAPKGFSVQTIRNSGILLSTALSIVLTFVIFHFSEPIAIHILSEERCAPLLKTLSLSIPLSALHGVICGSFYGQKKTGVPALSQLIEQLLRIGIIFTLWYYRKAAREILTPNDVMISLVLSELGAFLFLMLVIQLEGNHSDIKSTPHILFSGIILMLPMILPLSATRFFLDCIHSAESILIPNCLQMTGLSSSQAISLFGILSGMAMPFILFPSTITNSLAIMLMPTISSYDIKKNLTALQHTCHQSIQLIMILGILCTGLFITYGQSLGIFFFSNEQAGNYIKVLAWLCPFLYLSTTLGSILNGLGETTALFVHNLVSALLRLAIIIFAIPKIGILGYLWGLLASYILCVLMHYIRIARMTQLSLSAKEWIVKPFFAILIARIVNWAFETIYSHLGFSNLFLFMLLGGIIMSATYFFFLSLSHAIPFLHDNN
ncbi:MAG: polysaccharide biosynthesis C-terminal domain-containing protein [Lachnospiraceae bacterium]